MKKLSIHTVLISAASLIWLAGPSQTTENFYARPSVELTSVKNYLQEKCWQFSGFDIDNTSISQNNDGDGAMLPLSVTHFIANYYNKAVVLTWTTSSEHDNGRFEIERSLDGIYFEKAGSRNGKGTSETIHLYDYTDRVPHNIANSKDLYYRLKQVNFDGTATYSKPLVVRVYKTRSLQMVSVTPNPVVNDIKVNVQLKQRSYVVMKVVTNKGDEIMRKSARGTEGENNFTLEGTSLLQKDLYYLEVIINSDERMIIKLIKE